MFRIPSGAKAPGFIGHFAARLKPCPFKTIYEIASSVVNQKFVEEQPQILRLTTPNLHPTNEDLFVGTPERLKSTPGAPFAQDDSNFYAAYS